MIDDAVLFAREFVRRHRETGAVAPSSARLAQALARHVRTPDRPEGPRAVLEVGSGTGAVTRHIVRKLGPLDTLDLVEANPRFAAHLERALRSDPVLSSAASRIRVRAGFVQEFELSDYDAVVCGLPFANFAAADARAVLHQLLQSLSPTGTLSYFAYAGVPQLRRALTVGRARHRTLEVQSVVERIRGRHAFARELVVGNLPPAWVHHLAPGRAPAHAD